MLTPAWGAILGSALGAAQFALSESTVPKDSNCSYLAPWTTDLGAWIIGAALVYKGFQLDDGLISLAGATITSIHVAQYAAHKTGQRLWGIPESSGSNGGGLVGLGGG